MPMETAAGTGTLHCSLRGKEYVFKRICVAIIFGRAEDLVRERRLATIRELATLLPDKDRVEYLVRATRDAVPDGATLTKEVQLLLNSVEGVRMLLREAYAGDKPLDRAEVDTLLTEAPEDVERIVRELMGKQNGPFVQK